MKQRTVLQIIQSQRVIAFNPIFSDIGGDNNAGLMLSQLCYWSERTTLQGGWLYKTQEEWHEEARLSRRNIQTSRKALVKIGVIQYKNVGVPCKGHYRVMWDRLEMLILEKNLNKITSMSETYKQECTERTNKNVQNVQTRSSETYKQDRPKRTNKNVQNGQTITESTSESTSESTHKNKNNSVSNDTVKNASAVVAAQAANITPQAAYAGFSDIVAKTKTKKPAKTEA